MNLEVYMNKLLVLNSYEQIGKEFCKVYGYEMNHMHLLYLQQHPALPNPAVSLGSQEIKQELAQLAEGTADIYGRVLTEQNFIKPDKQIEFLPLQRYIHIPGHSHNFIEMVFVVAGVCKQIMDGHESIHPAGDITIVPPGIRHELHADENTICFTAKIRKENFLELFSDILFQDSILSAYFKQALTKPFFHCAVTLHSQSDSGDADPFFLNTVLEMYLQQEEDNTYSESIITSLLSALFAYILQNYGQAVELLVSNFTQNGQMLEILSYIYANYQHITLGDVAKHFYFSVPYLSKLIKEKTGQTFSALLKEFRLERAADILKAGDMKIDDVCDIVGYASTAQFIRAFKERYGVTPGEYRRLQS